jgi:hypothetical protein
MTADEMKVARMELPLYTGTNFQTPNRYVKQATERILLVAAENVDALFAAGRLRNVSQSDIAEFHAMLNPHAKQIRHQELMKDSGVRHDVYILAHVHLFTSLRKNEEFKSQNAETANVPQETQVAIEATAAERFTALVTSISNISFSLEQIPSLSELENMERSFSQHSRELFTLKNEIENTQDLQSAAISLIQAMHSFHQHLEVNLNTIVGGELKKFNAISGLLLSSSQRLQAFSLIFEGNPDIASVIQAESLVVLETCDTIGGYVDKSIWKPGEFE